MAMTRPNPYQAIADKLLAQFCETTGRNVSMGEPIRSKEKLGMLLVLLQQMSPGWERYMQGEIPPLVNR